MSAYLVLIRGINVGGKNKIPMAALRQCLENLGFSAVSTYIASGNVILRSDKSAAEVKAIIESALPAHFKLGSELIKVLVLDRKQLQTVVERKPAGFGEHPETYYSDVIFLIGIDVSEALPVFDPREGVDVIWPGQGVIYSQRLGEQRTKSRLNKIVGTLPYRSMTIRTWNTTVALLALLQAAEAA
ncbi:MAG TPA: DUF1697 domain-containing protein [Candidatus Saccharimonadales bacterium]|nr:DUF1697 domain-containing protein [Candidatus Saccharimonadales bacterium]